MRLQIKKADGMPDARSLASLAEWVIETAVSIQQIPAPTFQERQRAAFVSTLMQEHGLTDIDIDGMHNVYGRLPGQDPALPALMIVAHTDTVFGADTALNLRREAGTLHGPGIGDNSLGVGGMLGIMHLLTQRGQTPDRDLWFVATSCEEGLGDLKGMRAAFTRLRDRIGAVVNLEGLAFGHVYHAGIAVKRLRISARTGGGHSWLHFGRPSAIHVLMQLGAKISALKPPQSPRTTFNIGLIEGGTSINSIAARADLWLDLRSEDMNALSLLEEEVYRLIYSLKTADTAFDVEIVGERPAGSISPTHPLVQAAVDALAQVGIRATLETGSTDGNIALAAGCPTVTVGITRGGNAHRLDEYAETGPVKAGMQQLFQLVLSVQHKDFMR